jgi:DNA-binding LacI/PurR family transcriptional regulator
MSINIKQIAKISGVSVATVSRVLNKPESVLPETREKILAVIKEVGYAPNPLAKAFSTGETNLIALIVPTLDNSFFAQLAEGCQTYLLSKGYNLIIICSDKYEEHELGILKSIDQRQFRGVMVSGSGLYEDGYEDILKQFKCPMIVIENLAHNYSFSTIFVNDISGIEAALNHFLQTGHRNIAAVTGEMKLLTTQRRLSFLKDYLSKKLPDYEVPVVSAKYSSLYSGKMILKELLLARPKPTAIFAFNDVIALGIIKEAMELGIKIPEELSIIGFDNIPVSSYFTPALSTVNSPSEELGKEAAKLLLDKIDNNEQHIRNILLPVELILRESTINVKNEALH